MNKHAKQVLTTIMKKQHRKSN